MRLICPNCGAQYAVADDVIPPQGRDVQCSNCAHTWFETPGASAKDTEPPRTARPPTPEPSPHGEDLAPAPRAPANRRTVDPDVADILREEAARETAKRREEAPAPVETQTDLGLKEPPRDPRRPDPAPVAKATTAAAATGAVAVAAKAKKDERRERLPDIDDVDSKLGSARGRPRTTVQEVTVAEEAKSRKGFRRGFFLVLVLIAILAAIYVQAPAIKAAVPALAGTLDSYVAVVDQSRVWLDETLRGLLLSISGDGQA